MSQERLHHLDFLRASMMLLGVLVHASHADYDLGDYDGVRFLSGSFRMACFFIISGYFVPTLLERLGPREFLTRRLVVLGVPALFCVLALNPPVISMMRAYFAAAPVPTEARINWHAHAWFLLVLMIYTLLAARILSVTRWLSERLARLGISEGGATAIIMVGLIAAAAVGVKAVHKGWPTALDAGRYVVGPAVKNLPYFTLGLLLRRSPAAFAFVHARPSSWAVAAVGLLGLRFVADQHPITTTAQSLLRHALDYTTALACSFALLGAVQRVIQRPNHWVRLVSESAYTVYLVHYLFIAVVLVVTQRLGLDVPARALLAAAVAFAGGVALHVGLVRRAPLAAFLLNGRPLPWHTVGARSLARPAGGQGSPFYQGSRSPS